MTLTQDRRTALIGGCPLFRGLDDTGLGALAGAAVEVDFPADRVIARAGRDRHRLLRRSSRAWSGSVRDGAVVAQARPRGVLRRAVGARRRAAHRPGRGRGAHDAASRSRPGTSSASCATSRGWRWRCCGWSPGDSARCRRTAGPSAADRGDVTVAPARPTGAVTFLFTDIEGSTKLVDRLGTAAWRPVLARHRELVRAALAAEEGLEIGTEGDSFFAVFRDPRRRGPRRRGRPALAVRRALAGRRHDPGPDGDPHGRGRARRRRGVRGPRRPSGRAGRGRGVAAARCCCRRRR